MPLFQQYHIENGILLLWEMTESTEEILAFAGEFERDPNFKQITHPQRQREWLCVRKLLQSAACHHHQISYTENGKPVINHPTFKSISISHSSKMAGVFLHPGEMAGLDIESADRNFAKVERKYLSAAESELAAQIPDGLAWFWCIKEAAYKAAGIPGLIFNQQIEIEKGIDGTLQAIVMGNHTLRFKIHQKKIDGQLIVCLSLQSG